MSQGEEERIGVVAALVRSSFLVNAVYTQSGREYGLTQQQGQLLCVLMSKPYGMGELGEVLGLARSSLTGLVDRTERNGLVRREADPADARATRIVLTTKGGALADEFYAETSRRIDGLTRTLTGPEREAVAGLLGRIVLTNEVPVVFKEQDGAER